jgi:hypothetical protein
VWKWDRTEDDFVETRHPKYRPALFKCDVCDCEVQK